MAGNYPDVPGHRMAYDRDGSVGFNANLSGATSVALTPTELAQLNDESAATALTVATPQMGIGCAGIIFPELRDIVGYFAFPGIVDDATINALDTSVDSTTGLDGTWVTRLNPWVAGGAGAGYRMIQAVNYVGIKAIRLRGQTPSGFDYFHFYYIHLYGSIAAGQNPHRLRLWHPTLDQELGAAELDWGDIPRNSTDDRIFRVKNNSTTKTADTITVGIEALTDTSPTVVGQYTFSNGGAYAATTSIATLAPEAISGQIVIRRTTPANAALSVWTARVKAEAATFA